MSTRVGGIEQDVESFISNMTIFVREELFALHSQRNHVIHPLSDSSSAQITDKKTTRKRGRRPPYALVSSTLGLHDQEYHSSTLLHQIPRSSATDSCNPSTQTTNTSVPIVRDENDDVYEMQIALQRIQTARERRRQRRE